MYQLRPHQQAAYDEIQQAIQLGSGTARGRVVVPTGGGKTFIEAAILRYQMESNATTHIHLVLAPRILLANQLIDEYRKFLGNQAYRAVAFHSGQYEPDYTKIRWKETNTTRASDLEQFYRDAVRTEQHLVVFSTYHSANKLLGIKFDTLIADESQYCVSENFNDVVKSLTAKVRLFFTATERYTASDRGRGLNNSEIFGQRLYYISPADLIKQDLIVPPRLHIMYAETRSEQDSIVSEVIEIAAEQDRLTRKDLGFSKILFAMNGTDDVKSIEDNISRLRQRLPEHDIFTITSRTGAKINGVTIRRENFLEELRTRTNCLIFHYDILSEGIDVDGITGVALMRNMGLAKLLQTIGRAVRVYRPDPGAKRQAWISVSVLNGNEDDKERVKYYINAIRDGGYDISAEDVVETGTPRHSADPGDVEDAYTKLKPNWAGLFVTEVFHEIENEAFWDTIFAAGDTRQQLLKFLDTMKSLA